MHIPNPAWLNIWSYDSGLGLSKQNSARKKRHIRLLQVCWKNSQCVPMSLDASETAPSKEVATSDPGWHQNGLKAFCQLVFWCFASPLHDPPSLPEWHIQYIYVCVYVCRYTVHIYMDIYKYSVHIYAYHWAMETAPGAYLLSTQSLTC